MGRYRVGLVGLAQARHFVDIFNSYPDFEVTALCDINETFLNQVGEELNIAKRFTSYEQFLDSDIDVVELSTPIQVHGEQAIAAMRTGRHVLCQYVAANTPEEAAELLEVAEASGKKYMFIETDCYERKNRIMMALAGAGAFGELVTGCGDYLHYCASLGYRSDGSYTWRGEMWAETNGGEFIAVHTAMPFLEMFGERVESVFAAGPGSRLLPEFRLNDGVFVFARFPSGRVVELRHGILLPRPARTGYTLYGTEGCFEIDRAAVLGRDLHEPKQDAWQTLDELAEAHNLGEVATDYGGHRSAFELCVRDFVSAIHDETAPRMDLYDALHITAIGWAAEKSLDTGQPVDVIQYD